MKWRRALIPLAGVSVLAAWYFTADRGSGYVPLKGNEFAEVVLVRLDTQEPVQEIVEMPVGTGFLAELRISPKSVLPSTVRDPKTDRFFAVQPPLNWCLTLAHYPRGYAIQEADNEYWSHISYYRDPQGRKKYRSVLMNMPGGFDGWQECGFTNPPPPPVDLKKDDLRFWTYIAAKPGESGDVVYEIKLMPTAYIPKGWATIRQGPKVPVWRGEMRIR